MRLENRIAPALVSDFSHITGLLSVTSNGSDSIVLAGNNAAKCC